MLVLGVFLSIFSRIRTKYGEILRISPYSVQMRENMDKKNSENGHFLSSELIELKYNLQQNVSITFPEFTCKEQIYH